MLEICAVARRRCQFSRPAPRTQRRRRGRTRLRPGPVCWMRGAGFHRPAVFDQADHAFVTGADRGCTRLSKRIHADGREAGFLFALHQPRESNFHVLHRVQHRLPVGSQYFGLASLGCMDLRLDASHQGRWRCRSLHAPRAVVPFSERQARLSNAAS